MMKTALVLGGTRFFGVQLVKSLLNQDVKVTIATRGITTLSFPKQVEWIQFDRNSEESFQMAFEGRKWDVVFDQICYTALDAKKAIHVFQNKSNKYIFTSTLSVYDLIDRELYESDFDPATFPIKITDKEEVDYQAGKRGAEAMFFQKAPFPVTAVRFPIVLGENDYTERMIFYIKKVLNDEVIYLRNLDASISFIHEEEAGQFLSWISSTDFQGPINACTNGTVTLREFITYIEEATGKKAIVEISQNTEHQTPYSISSSWTMSNQKAKDIGFQFNNIHIWLPELISKSL